MENKIYGNISTVEQEMQKMSRQDHVPAEVFDFGMDPSDQEMIIPHDLEGQHWKRTPHSGGLRTQHCTLYSMVTICVILLIAGVFGGAIMYSQISAKIEHENRDVSALQAQVEKLKFQVEKNKEELLQNIQSVGADVNSQVDKKINDLKKKLLSGCEENLSWTQFGDRWYSLSQCSGSWETARQQCVAMDSTLAMEFLAGLTKDSRYWLGLNDLGSEGTWKWLDGSSAENSNGLWNEGEPNNMGDEDCGEMRNGRLNDVPCNLRRQWICGKRGMAL